MRKNRNEQAHWLERAQHARTHAEAADDKRTRAKLLGFANAYETIARRAESIGKIRLIRESA